MQEFSCSCSRAHLTPGMPPWAPKVPVRARALTKHDHSSKPSMPSATACTKWHSNSTLCNKMHTPSGKPALPGVCPYWENGPLADGSPPGSMATRAPVDAHQPSSDEVSVRLRSCFPRAIFCPRCSCPPALLKLFLCVLLYAFAGAVAAPAVAAVA